MTLSKIFFSGAYYFFEVFIRIRLFWGNSVWIEWVFPFLLKNYDQMIKKYISWDICDFHNLIKLKIWKTNSKVPWTEYPKFENGFNIEKNSRVNNMAFSSFEGKKTSKEE